MNGFAQLPKVLPPLLAFSLVSNLAVLISPIFMMQVLDRVLPSGNISTLVLLGGLACAALLVQALVELARDLSLGRLARWSEAAGTQLALQSPHADSQLQISRTASVTEFLGGSLAPVALSLPWLPLFLLALLMLHPGFALLVLGLVALSALLRWGGDTLSQGDLHQAAFQAQAEQRCLDNAATFAPKVGIAVIARHLQHRFAGHQSQKHTYQDRAHLAQASQAAGVTFLRALAQISALALGAYLVTQEALSAGGMIAGSLLVGKTYATFDGAWAQQSRIRQALADIRALAALPIPTEDHSLEIPELSGGLRAEGLIVPRGQGKPPRLDRISFELEPGECLAIVGSSGAGKSTLLQALAGITPAPIGSVFFDQSEVRSLSDQCLFRHTGVLPQQARLLPGTLAENIACFAPDAASDQILDAARTAGVHGLISALPEAYDTDMTHDLHLLSVGQRQRVALARAVYMTPRYLFLDEPNALLDADGERALAQTLHRLKDQGVTIVMVLQRSGIMWLADKVLRLDAGRCADFGNKAEVLGRMMSNRHQIELPLLPSSLSDLTDWIATRFTRASDAAFSQKTQIIGAELFNIALENGAPDHARTAQFIFAFKDDTHCELKMVEEGGAQAAGKIRKIREMVEDPASEMWTLPKDELALAMVDQMSESFDVSHVENYALYSVALADHATTPLGKN